VGATGGGTIALSGSLIRGDDSCVSASLCVAGDSDGNLVASTNPTGGAAAWSAPAHVDTNNTSMSGVSCTSSPSLLCVAVDANGRAFTSTNPTGGITAWTGIDTGHIYLYDVSCAAASLCVAVDRYGNVLTGVPRKPSAGTPPVTGPAGNPLGLPSNAHCVDTRKWKFKLHHPRGSRIIDVLVVIKGKRTLHVKVQHGSINTVTLKKLPQKKFKVTITATRNTGAQLISVRTYKGCKKSKPHPRHSHR
jgi:hypothetical protein